MVYFSDKIVVREDQDDADSGDNKGRGDGGEKDNSNGESSSEDTGVSEVYNGEDKSSIIRSSEE